MTAKLTYSKVAALVKRLVKKGVNIYHPLVADEVAKIIDQYAEQQATEFAEWVRSRYSYNYHPEHDVWVPGKLTTEQLYQIFKEEQK